jgi:hypothetical protein
MAYIRNFVVPALLMTTPATTVWANVITDWDEKAVSIIQGNAPVPPPPFGPIGGLRIMTVMHIAMFETVNAIDPRYESYKGSTRPKVDASEEAAAATAAATVLSKMDPEISAKTKAALDAYLAQVANGDAKDRGNCREYHGNLSFVTGRKRPPDGCENPEHGLGFVSCQRGASSFRQAAEPI